MHAMEERLPQPVHRGDEVAPAPGDLELIRGFMSLHDHARGTSVSFQPSPDALAWWLRTNGLLPPDAETTEEDLAWAFGVRAALVAKVRENMGEPIDPDLVERLDLCAVETGLRPRFDHPRLDTAAGGIRGAIGVLLGIAFMAELDGSWHRFRMCANPECLTVFYDRSKNHSARWCSMQACGNRNKVRAFRERHAPTS
jgi:CGNR zinc finger protein/putative stress-induced transcription regulator